MGGVDGCEWEVPSIALRAKMGLVAGQAIIDEMIAEEAPPKLLTKNRGKGVVCGLVRQGHAGLAVVVLAAAEAEGCAGQAEEIFEVEACNAFRACSCVLIYCYAVVGPNRLRLSLREHDQKREEQYCR
jgi:hypothetical protein